MLEIEAIIGDTDFDNVTGTEFALQDLLSQRVLYLLLNRPSQRSCAVDRIESGRSKPVARGLRQVDAHVTIGETIVQVSKLNIDNAPNVFPAQRMKYDDVVNTIDEFGSKMCPDHVHNSRLHLIVLLLTSHFLDHLRAEI